MPRVRASGTGSCHCGAPYVPAGERTKAALPANTDKTDRALAAELGVSHMTIRRAREVAGVTNVTPEKRTGRDGKTRRMPATPWRQSPVGRRRSDHACALAWANLRLRGDRAPRLAPRRRSPEKFLPKTYQIIFAHLSPLERLALSAWMFWGFGGEPGWDRTNDHLIKSQMLYR